MTIAKWLSDNKFTAKEYDMCRTLLMTGPRAQHPTWRAIRKTLGRWKRGDVALAAKRKQPLSSWRAARSV